MEDRIQINLVYVGVRCTKTKTSARKSYCYQPLTDDGEQISVLGQRLFQKQLLKCAVGSILEVSCNISGDVMRIYGDGTYKGQYKDEVAIKDWQIRSDSESTLVELEQLQYQYQNQDPLKPHLEPLRTAYRNLSRVKRRAFLAYLINYLED